MLNLERPPNPFTPTEQPDWKASKTTARKSYAHKYDSLEDRNTHRLSQTSDRSHPLPADIKSMGEAALRGDTLRKSRQSSATSMSLNVAPKAAPPIPKKPALLSNRQHSHESWTSERRLASRPPLGGQIAFDDGAKTEFPPPPDQIRQQKIYGQPGSHGPPLPPRSTSGIVPFQNGLMDDDNIEASAIPSLQPTRRQHTNADL